MQFTDSDGRDFDSAAKVYFETFQKTANPNLALGMALLAGDPFGPRKAPVAPQVAPAVTTVAVVGDTPGFSVVGSSPVYLFNNGPGWSLIYTNHEGLDTPCSLGDQVTFNYTGTVVFSADNCYGYGSCIVIQDNTSKKLYLAAHLSQRNVEFGDPITSGQLIGLAGNTTGGAPAVGVHLHQGTYISPDDTFNGMLYPGTGAGNQTKSVDPQNNQTAWIGSNVPWERKLMLKKIFMFYLLCFFSLSSCATENVLHLKSGAAVYVRSDLKEKVLTISEKQEIKILGDSQPYFLGNSIIEPIRIQLRSSGKIGYVDAQQIEPNFQFEKLAGRHFIPIFYVQAAQAESIDQILSAQILKAPKIEPKTINFKNELLGSLKPNFNPWHIIFSPVSVSFLSGSFYRETYSIINMTKDGDSFEFVLNDLSKKKQVKLIVRLNNNELKVNLIGDSGSLLGDLLINGDYQLVTEKELDRLKKLVLEAKKFQ